MAEPTRTERDAASELAHQARERGKERLEGAKGQLAEGAERVAAAVDRTAEQLESDGDRTISGFGHSIASMMRQLSGGLRERDIDDFARELGTLARRNPGVFLAGSVALGFGVARFFKARTPSARAPGDGSWRTGARRSDGNERYDFDGDESLDLSDPTRDKTERRDAVDPLAAGVAPTSAASASSAVSSDERAGKTRAAGKSSKLSKPQRAHTEHGPQSASSSAPLGDRIGTAGGSSESGVPGEGSGTTRGGKDS